jgi:hypothetical protein
VETGATGEVAAAMNDARQAVALFVVESDAGRQVFGSTRQPGSGWSPAVPVSIGADAASPAVAIAPTGDAAAFWMEPGGVQAALRIAPPAE